MSVTNIHRHIWKKSVVMRFINLVFHIIEAAKSNNICHTRPENESAKWYNVATGLAFYYSFAFYNSEQFVKILSNTQTNYSLRYFSALVLR